MHWLLSAYQPFHIVTKDSLYQKDDRQHLVYKADLYCKKKKKKFNSKVCRFDFQWQRTDWMM